MIFVYNLVILFYYLLVRLAAFYVPKAKKWITGRQNIFSKISVSLSTNTSPVAWFHCASLGEFEQARPVIELFSKQWPTYCILLTFFSPSGYEIRKNYSKVDHVHYLPLDTKSNAKKFIEITKPAIAFFVKYDFWYHYLYQLKSNNIPVILFSAIFRPNQLFFKSYGKFYRNLLYCFTHIFVQDSASQQLLKKYNINTSEVAGDTRFDRVMELTSMPVELPIIVSFKNEQQLLVAGSTWKEDLSVILPALLNSPCKIIIAPHEINEAYVNLILTNFKGKAVRYSQAQQFELQNYKVLVVDNVGLLSQIYRYADSAYIGGGFGKGIHNILEASVWGIPVIFGPNHTKFKEANDLLKSGTAFSISSSYDMRNILKNLHEKPVGNDAFKIKNAAYFNSHIGASSMIIQHCNYLVTK